MPELPEAETIVRGLQLTLPGSRIAGVELLRAEMVRPDPQRFCKGLAGQTVERVGRRGKNVVFHLKGPHDGANVGGGTMVVNLGMTGRLHLAGGNAAPSGHPAVRFQFEDGRALVFDDTRRFGLLRLLTPEEWVHWSATLGPEPLGDAFTARALRRALSASRSPIRSWLLDQRRVAGVGNIYANEALFLAGVHPSRSARSLDGTEAARLHRSLRRILRQAIRSRGTTLRDYRDAEGREGSFSTLLRVYGRDGLPCGRCRVPIERLVLAGRSAFFCPRCQPPS